MKLIIHIFCPLCQCLGYYFIDGLKHHNQGSLQKAGFIWAYCYVRLIVHGGAEATGGSHWQLRTDTLNCQQETGDGASL